MNNKGFTLVEIMAVVAILGVVALLAIGGYTRYAEFARNESYKNLAKSAATAAEEFVMDNPGAAVETKLDPATGDTQTYVIKDADAPSISFKTLIDEGYLTGAADPGSTGTQCNGQVTIGLIKGDTKGAIDQYMFVVDSCCIAHETRYTYTYQKVREGSEYKVISKNIVDRNNAVCPGP